MATESDSYASPLDGQTSIASGPQQHSPQSSGENHHSPRRRKRKALSCYDCRRRKLRCDRELPCARCRQEGHADTCVFDSGPPRVSRAAELHHDSNRLNGHASPAATQNSSMAPTINVHDGPNQRKTGQDKDADTRLAAQEKRIAYLEDRLTHFETAQHLVDLERVGQPVPPPIPYLGLANKNASFKYEPGQRFRTHAAGDPANALEPIRIKGEDYATLFLGPTNPTSMVFHFEGLSHFARQTFAQWPSLQRVQGDMKALRLKHKNGTIKLPVNTDAELCNLLPHPDAADQLVRLYIDTFEQTYRILHLPSFWAEYNGCWPNVQAARPGFIVTMILMMATVNCMNTEESRKYVGESSSARATSRQWIRACEAWISRQSIKHTTLTVFQVRCLLVLAKQTNEIEKKIVWQHARALVSLGIGAGLHRNPSHLRAKTSILTQEMRRRLWITMLDMELYLCLDRGVPPSVTNVSVDCDAPLHINDEDLLETTDRAPVSRPDHEYTSSSFLHFSQRTLALRTSLTSIFNDTSNELNYEEVMNYDEKIMLELSKIPKWQDNSSTRRPGFGSAVARALLDVQLRQYLLLLHGPLARRADTEPRYNYSRMVVLNAAHTILEQHHYLAKQGNVSLSLLRHDVYFCGLYLCHSFFLSIFLQNDFFSMSLIKTLPQAVETSLSLLEDKTMRLGTGFNFYSHLSAAYTFTLMRDSREPFHYHQQQAVDRVTKLYFEALASQEDPTAVFPYLVAGKSENILSNESPFGPFDPLDVSAWTLDNLWTFDQIGLPGIQGLS